MNETNETFETSKFETSKKENSTSNLTPLMQQYENLKSAHPDEILLFRLGDFYEMFYDDARKAAPVLEVALTQRQGVPMCGMPYHAADRYIAKLLKKGFRIAIAEQMEEAGTGKGIVQRQVVRIVSTGTIVEENLLKEKSNNFILALHFSDLSVDKNRVAALAAIDISTGEFLIKEIETNAEGLQLRDELCILSPAEIVISQECFQQIPSLEKILNPTPIVKIGANEFGQNNPSQNNSAIEKFWEHSEWKNRPSSVQAGNLLLNYISKMNPAFLPNIAEPQWIAASESMILDEQTIENLEILRNGENGTAHTLLHFLDRTLTPMGARLLKQWLTHPLLQPQKIQGRLSLVEYFLQAISRRKQARELLKGLSDLERAIIRLGSAHTNPRDTIGIKLSLQKMQQLKNIWLQNSDQNNDQIPAQLFALLQNCPDTTDLIHLIETAISDEPPITLDQGGVIRNGYNALLDEKRQAAQEGKQWLQNLESREKSATGIASLKVGYTSVFGYYFEVTKTHLAKVPQSWHRKQTLVNAERFISEELKALESKILGAEEQSLRMERGLFQEITQQLCRKISVVQTVASAAAQLDCFLSLAETAESKNLTRPLLEESNILKIVDGWHPMVQESLEAGSFVPNDISLSDDATKIMIITGPNMSGKSTYLRQNALIVLMAQIGSFVPAAQVRMGIIDRVFTRIGSGDRLSKGESTFMVEMKETAQILKNATQKSLIILDEVGRGTSTYDGISIAWAIVEYLVSKVKAKTLFATHYFELTHLSQKWPGVENFNVQAKEWKDTVLFLHKIVPGPADRSYGVHVAQLAGLPQEVVQRSKKILQKLEQEHQSLLQSKQSMQLVFKLETEPATGL